MIQPAYNLRTIPDGKWSGAANGLPEPPAIGTTVMVKINGLGRGKVEAYFTEAGFVGVQVRLCDPPAWWIKQNKGRPFEGVALVFGAEVSPFIDARPFADEYRVEF